MENTINNTPILNAKKIKKTETAKKITAQTILYIILTIAAILSIFPFVFMLLASLMTNDQYRTIETVADFIPRTAMWKNYLDAFTYKVGGQLDFLKALANTMIVGITSTALGVILTILTAFAFAKLKFTGKNILFSIMLGTMMIPGELFTITNYITVSKLGMRNSYVVLILPFLVSIYYVYLLRNAFMQIPDELYKAAKIDGVSDMKYLVKVMVPLAAPTIISITILKLIATWNSYIWTELVNKANVAMLMLSNWMQRSGYSTSGDVSEVQYPIRMAAAVIITLPLLIVFLCFRKYIMKGVSKSGIKG